MHQGLNILNHQKNLTLTWLDPAGLLKPVLSQIRRLLELNQHFNLQGKHYKLCFFDKHYHHKSCNSTVLYKLEKNYNFSADCGCEPRTQGNWETILTTSAKTRVRTFSPISGEMSLPNCCRVVRKRFNLLSCRAPQVAGNCWFVSADEVEEAGPLLNLCGGDGAPFRVGGEWLMPLLTKRKPKLKDSVYTTRRPLLISSCLCSLSFIYSYFVKHILKEYARLFLSSIILMYNETECQVNNDNRIMCSKRSAEPGISTWP